MPAQENSTTTNAATDNHSGGNTLESLESWSAFFNGSVVVLTALLAVAGYFAWKYSSELVTLKDEALTRFKLESAKEISAANARSAEANQKASEAGLNASTANERAGKLEVEATTQRKFTAEANERAGKLEVELVNAKKELLEIQERLKPRLMNEAVRTRLLQVLTGVPKGSAIIGSVLGDGEARSLSLQIKKILEASGWTVKATMSIRTDAPEGFFMAVKDWNNPPASAVALRQFFESIGIPVKVRSDATLPEETMGMLVGMKP